MPTGRPAAPGRRCRGRGSAEGPSRLHTPLMRYAHGDQVAQLQEVEDGRAMAAITRETSDVRQEVVGTPIGGKLYLDAVFERDEDLIEIDARQIVPLAQAGLVQQFEEVLALIVQSLVFQPFLVELSLFLRCQIDGHGTFPQGLWRRHVRHARAWWAWCCNSAAPMVARSFTCTLVTASSGHP